MSYILDALHKSERERQRLAPPSIHTNHVIDDDKAPRLSAPWSKWLVMIGVLLAGISATIIFWPQSYPPVPPQSARESNSIHTSLRHESAPAKPVMQPSTATRLQPQATVAVNHDVSSAHTVAAPPVEPLRPHQNEPKNQPNAQQANTSKLIQITPSPPTTRQDVLAVSANANAPGIPQLPENIQQALPAISIAGHIYSEASASRIVMINGKFVHEGESIASGLILETITPDGIILMFRGARFHMGIFQHWPPGS